MGGVIVLITISCMSFVSQKMCLQNRIEGCAPGNFDRWLNNIDKNKHMPDIPSANDIKENGLSLAEINAHREI